MQWISSSLNDNTTSYIDKFLKNINPFEVKSFDFIGTLLLESKFFCYITPPFLSAYSISPSRFHYNLEIQFGKQIS